MEIWLGNSHRGSIGNAKRSAGRIYVESVAFANMEDEKDGDTVTKSMAVQFAEKLTAYNNDRHANLSQIFDAAYSFKNIDFAAYDSYDKSFVKYPYNWQLSVDGGETDGVRYGIFDPSGAGRDATVPAYFVGPKSGGNVLLLANLNPAASTVSYNGSVSLNADTYYKIDVLLKVDIAKEQERSEAVGAKLALSGTKFAFRNITDTSEKSDSITDAEAFQTYTFYIKTGSEATSSTLSLSLGEAAYAKQCSGRAYIGSVTYTDITAVAYDEAAAGINDGTLTRALLADLSTADDETDEEPAEPVDNTLSWWLIPSILFAVAILIALIGFLIRKIMEKRADKKGVVQKAASYDRNATLNVEHNKNAADGEKVAASDGTAADESYTAFDEDNAAVAEKPSAEDAPAEEKQTETTEQTTEETPTVTEENTVGATAEETVATETPEPTKEETPKQDSFIDRFDD